MSVAAGTVAFKKLRRAFVGGLTDDNDEKVALT